MSALVVPAKFVPDDGNALAGIPMCPPVGFCDKVVELEVPDETNFFACTTAALPVITNLLIGILVP
jgi:hypothetical protein